MYYLSKFEFIKYSICIMNPFKIVLCIGLCLTLESTAQTDSSQVEKTPSWEKTITWGTSLSHTLNINAPIGTPRQSMSFSNALDISLNYIKETSKFKALNEVHWLFTFAKADSRSRTLNSADQVLTFHDLSYAIKNQSKWNANLIIKTESPLFKQYQGNFLKDYAQLGPIQAFLNPYTLNISPGIKYQAAKHFGISLAPYSLQLFGLTDQFIADKGDFIQERKSDGHYETKLFTPLGTDLNIWLKKKIGKRFDIDYKYSVSYNAFTDNLTKGKMTGLFLTNFKIVKGLKLTHRATIKGNFDNKPFKPFYNQVVLLSYTLSI